MKEYKDFTKEELREFRIENDSCTVCGFYLFEQLGIVGTKCKECSEEYGKK